MFSKKKIFLKKIKKYLGDDIKIRMEIEYSLYYQKGNNEEKTLSFSKNTFKTLVKEPTRKAKKEFLKDSRTVRIDKRFDPPTIKRVRSKYKKQLKRIDMNAERIAKFIKEDIDQEE
ncbi:MAG: hypothetical protein NC182_01820 [Prevotella sp.]|nr:hypothetical protein [Staphylococcus sp.]MCM1349921.1 hypothetical protein [Prevotella sp.]